MTVMTTAELDNDSPDAGDLVSADEISLLLTADFLASLRAEPTTPTTVFEAEIIDPTSGESVTVRALSMEALEAEIDAAFGVDAYGYAA